jgi:hypothetical protein
LPETINLLTKSATITDLLDELLEEIGRHVTKREEIRCWRLSGVERIVLDGGDTLIFKRAAHPFDREDEILTHVARHHPRVPRLVASHRRDGLLGMLLEDLGPPIRPATLAEGAQAAVATHRIPAPAGLTVLDSAALGRLPASSLAGLAELVARDRWRDVDDIHDRLQAIAVQAEDRAQGAELPPFGLCHSEFHPTSIYVTASGWWLLDWARAFTGPGLLDLASWQNTRDAPDPDAFGHMLDAYIRAGGPPEAAATRGGLPPERWAFAWHRLWIVEWFLAQATTWLNDPADDTLYQKVIRRHLDEALDCMNAT